MSTLNELKNELILQKKAIESKGGTVNVANTNPSPSEITAGIDGIVIPDLSSATATEADVVSGKTFFALDNNIKTGTMQACDYSSIMDMFCPYLDKDEEYNFILPEGVKTVRAYLLYRTTRTVNVTLNSDVETINDYAFYADSIYIENLPELEHIKKVGVQGFGGCKGVDLANLPTSLTTLGNQAFCNVISTSGKIVTPPNVVSYGLFAFGSNGEKFFYNGCDMSGFTLSIVPNSFFQNLVFDCDLELPSCVTKLNMNFNLGGSFNHVTIPAGFLTMAAYAFGSSYIDSQETYNMKYMIFLGENPPTFGNAWLSELYLKPGYAIYVPDNSVEAYSAVLDAEYVPYVKPMSEKAD